jgi:hypothetical protein
VTSCRQNSMFGRANSSEPSLQRPLVFSRIAARNAALSVRGRNTQVFDAGFVPGILDFRTVEFIVIEAELPWALVGLK